MVKRFLLVIGLIGIFCFYGWTEYFWEDSTTITLYVDDIFKISAPHTTRIAIGKPEVADVVKVTEEKIFLKGKAQGETTLVWWDKYGEHSRHIKVFKENMTKIKERIDAVLKEAGIEGIQTKALDSEGKVLLSGELKEDVDKARLYAALEDLKDKIVDFIKIRGEETSVEIDVQVLEIDTGATKTLGIDIASMTSINFTDVSASTTTGVSSITALFRASDWTRSAFSSTLDLLIREGKARILSRPKLVCRSGKKAELLVGGEVPVFTTQVASAGGQGTNIRFKKFGIQLSIEPKVVDNTKIDIKLNVEVSDVGEAETIGSSSNVTAKAFSLIKRTVSTDVSLKDGTTLLIGGLIKRKTSEDLQKFPWLADIPVLGLFFRHKSITKGGGSAAKGDTELFITLTPKIIPTDFGEKEKKTIAKRPLKKEAILDIYSQSIPADMKEYVNKIKSIVTNNMYYPSSVIDTGWEANLVVTLRLTETGELKEAKVTRASGYKIFDNQTLEIIKKLSFPPFPPKVKLKEVTIDIPIVYKPKS